MTNKVYRNYLSFGFNCELGFALEYLGIFNPTLFSWADIRGTDALLYGIKHSEKILENTVTHYASDMFFCNESQIGFHGKLKFSSALKENGFIDDNLITNSLNETRSRIRHLENKQRAAIQEGGALIIVKYFSDIFKEPYTIEESMKLVRNAITEKYETNDFDLLYITEHHGTNKTNIHCRNFIRGIKNFSPRSNAMAIDKNEWKNVMSEFIYPETRLSPHLKKTSEHWSKVKPTGLTRWWNNPTIVDHVNKLICGEDVHGPSAGIFRRLQSLAQGKRFEKGISIACGNGAKELQLLKNGIVDHFDLFEISHSRVEQGEKLARELGLQNKVRFHVANVFDQNLDGNFDLVYWDSALHHMLDVHAAVKLSHDILSKGGCFFMHDYVGASRFQWSDFQCKVATQARELLPKRLLRDPSHENAFLPTQISAPNVRDLISMDPSEAADSDNIISSVKNIFPNVDITYTGGAIYHMTLNDVIANFEPEDEPLLLSLLLLDTALIELGESHFAVASAIK